MENREEIQELLEDIIDCERIIKSQVEWIEKNEQRLRELGYPVPDRIKEQVREKLREGINIPRYVIVKAITAEDIKYSKGIEEAVTIDMYKRLGTYLRNVDENVKKTEQSDGSVQLKIEYIMMTPEKFVDAVAEIIK